jgi:hypothetical protein
MKYWLHQDAREANLLKLECCHRFKFTPEISEARRRRLETIALT